MTDLLPINASKTERALSLATARVGAVPVPLKNLWSPDTCPEAILPWLAWSLSLDDWSNDWSVSQKRAAIAASVEIHRKKGTVGAVRRALQAIGYEVFILEETSGPYTFSIYIDVSSGPVPDSAFAEAERSALSNKNVRSHLDGVGIGLGSRGAFRAYAATINGEDSAVWPDPVRLLDSSGSLFAYAVLQDVVTTSVLPFGVALDFDFTADVYPLVPVTTDIQIDLT